MFHRACLLGIAAMVVATGGCASDAPKEDPTTIAKTTVQAPIVGRPELRMPILVAGQSVCIVPFALEDEKAWYEERDPFARRGRASTALMEAGSGQNSLGLVGRWACVPSGRVRWHNAILRDLKSADEWSILDRRGVISEYAIYTRQRSNESPRAEAMIFLATVADSNRDGELTASDANQAIVTGGDGRGARVVSPEGSRVVTYSPDAENLLLYLGVAIDDNRDGVFTGVEAIVPYVCELRGDAPARPVVSKATLDRVEALLR